MREIVRGVRRQIADDRTEADIGLMCDYRLEELGPLHEARPAPGGAKGRNRPSIDGDGDVLAASDPVKDRPRVVAKLA